MLLMCRLTESGKFKQETNAHQVYADAGVHRNGTGPAHFSQLRYLFSPRLRGYLNLNYVSRNYCLRHQEQHASHAAIERICMSRCQHYRGGTHGLRQLIGARSHRGHTLILPSLLLSRHFYCSGLCRTDQMRWGILLPRRSPLQPFFRMACHSVQLCGLALCWERHCSGGPSQHNGCRETRQPA